MALFLGEFEQTIDAKHRLAINAPLRESIDPKTDGEDFVLLLGPDRHLWLVPNLVHSQMTAQLKRTPLPNRASRKMDLWFAMARVLKMDAQGRVVLPEKSMQRALINDKVTLVGQNDHIEIWPTDEWEKHVSESLPGYGDTVYDAGDRMGVPPGEAQETSEQG